jgi:DNA-repair protein complementing XP-A cells
MVLIVAPSLNQDDNPQCFECGSIELDFLYHKTFGTRVCFKCKDKFPEKYSLLTKTECKEDYLLTDPELRDEELLPHLLKSNPHKSTFANMMLYVRYQVEEFAWKKWGGAKGLDQEWGRRTKIKKEKKDKKFEQQLRDLRKRTRTEAFTKLARQKRQKYNEEAHEHEFGPGVQLEGEDVVMRKCEICGMETEEIVL